MEMVATVDDQLLGEEVPVEERLALVVLLWERLAETEG